MSLIPSDTLAVMKAHVANHHHLALADVEWLFQEIDALTAERDGLERVARVLLRQVKRGGPSNIENFATDYFGDDAALFTAHVVGEAESA